MPLEEEETWFTLERQYINCPFWLQNFSYVKVGNAGGRSVEWHPACLFGWNFGDFTEYCVRGRHRPANLPNIDPDKVVDIPDLGMF